MLYQQTTLNCNGKILDLSVPRVMGIINTTPDSFYADSRFQAVDAVLRVVENMLKEGAALIDIGAVSTRPKADMLDAGTEWRRLEPVLAAVFKAFPEVIVSVDTFRAVVAEKAIDMGAGLINDVSGGQIDGHMFETVGRLKVPYVLMHMRGTPQTMQDLTQYDDLVTDILDYFIEKVGILRGYGATDIVLDLGFGFSKTVAQNFELLKKMAAFQVLDCPILAGLSRKSMIWKTLGTSPEEALNGTTAAHVYALQQGAKILRVHDVKAAVETIKIHQLLS